MLYKAILSFSKPRSLLQRVRRKLFGSKFPTAFDLIRKYAPGKAFADIGCMWGIDGANSFFAESCGAARVVAVDVYPPTEQFIAERDRVKSRLEFIFGDVNQLETIEKIGQIEIVYCTRLFYHMPDPFSLLAHLRAICKDLLILKTMIIPEVPGLRNAAVFYPMLDERSRSRFKLGTGMQKAITGPYEPESGYGKLVLGSHSKLRKFFVVLRRI